MAAGFGLNLDYTDKDEDAIRARLTNLLAGTFPTWTDHNRANFGNLLLWLMSFVGGVLTFYQDNQAGESRISDAKQRKNLIALAKLLGFTPFGATAAVAELKLTLASVPVGFVPFKAGDTFRTKEITDPVVFQLLEDATLPASTDPPELTVLVENSVSHTETLPSNGAPNQEYQLAQRPFLDGSLVPTAADGSYTVVSSLLSSTASDKHCTVAVDQNDRATVRFGNGVNGKIPVGTISFRYKTGGGEVGNVEQNSIQKVDGTYTDSVGNPVIVSCDNERDADGGSARMSSAQIRELAPQSIRVLNRTVAREDYEINARRDARVARALMLTSDQKTAIAENQGRLYVVPVGGGLPTEELKDAVYTLCTVTYPNTITFKLFVTDPVYKTINVVATVFVAEGQTPSVVKQRIIDNLEDWFAFTLAAPLAWGGRTLQTGSENPRVNFGFYYKNADGTPASEIAYSDIYDVVRDTEGVRKMDDGSDGLVLNGSSRDVDLELEEFPQLGIVTVINGDTATEI